MPTPGPTCAVDLTWAAAEAACGGPVYYSVHRSTTPGFTPIAGPIGDATTGTVAAIPISIGGVGHCGVAVGDPGPPQVASGPVGSTVPGPPPIIPPPYCVGGSCTGTPPPPPPPCCLGIVEQPVIFEPPPD